MKVLETEEERKSLIFTAISFAVLLLLLIWLKSSNTIDMSELEGGGGGGDIAVNFGNSDFGSGDNYQSMEVVKSAPKQVQPAVTAKEEILTSETEDAPVIANIKKPADKPKPAEVVKPIVKPVPKPSKSTNEALSSVLNGSDNSGDGNDKVGGNKGKAYGDTNATGYDGGGGSGTGSGGGNGSGQGIGTGSGYGSGTGGGRGSGVGNYMLSGRKVLSKPAPRYTCNEQGVVVVEISVNSSGSVIGATAGVRGTTNTAQCLLEQAKIAAMSTKFDASPDNNPKQFGRIIYNFKLTE
jgi:outer membrane biosynthesis protein TonB